MPLSLSANISYYILQKALLSSIQNAFNQSPTQLMNRILRTRAFSVVYIGWSLSTCARHMSVRPRVMYW